MLASSFPVETESQVRRSALAALEVERLRVEFPTVSGEPRVAIRDLDLSIGTGEILGLVGESGAGKTTLARAIMQLVPPPGRIARGRIRFRGEDLAGLDPERLRQLRGQVMAMVIANPKSELNPLLTVGQQIGNVLR